MMNMRNWTLLVLLVLAATRLAPSEHPHPVQQPTTSSSPRRLWALPNFRSLRGGEPYTPSRIRTPARVYGGRARPQSLFSDDSDDNGALHSQRSPGVRYPRSYGKETRFQDSLPLSVKSGATPWKGPGTPHYIHAKPTPASARTEHDSSSKHFGEVVTVEPTTRHTASVIWLHGLGDTGHTWSAVASWLQMSWTRFIFPTAPSQPVSVKFGYAMPSWFDFNSLDMENIDEDLDSMQDSIDYLHARIEREIASGVRPERIMLAGFAQGGVVALAAALQCKYRLGGVLALSSWLPKNMFRHPDSVSACAQGMPIWYHHGTDDKVVRQELGWESYQRTRQLGLPAYFKLYEGLGHEYGSQEMVDVQSFLFRRIPADLQGPSAQEPPLSAMKPAPRGMSRRRGLKHGGGTARSMTVGGVAAHFNAPWQYAISTGVLKEAGVNLAWKDCTGGTERMTQLLDKGELDIAVLSTDGAVAEIANGGSFKIVAPFVSSPLRYGVYVAGPSNLRRLRDLEGQGFAISRRGSLSHLMTYLHSTQAGWNPRLWDKTKGRLVEVGNLAGARDALRSGRAAAFLWEVGAARGLVESGELRMLGECSPPWPSFVVAARSQMLETEDGMEAVREVLRGMQMACRRFRKWPGRVNMLCHRYNLKTEDARGRLEETVWSCENIIAEEMLDEVAFNLVAVGLLSTFPATEGMFCSLSEAPSHSTSSPRDNAETLDEEWTEAGAANGGGARVRFHEDVSSRLGGEDSEDESEEPSSASKHKIRFRKATPHPGVKMKNEATQRERTNERGGNESGRDDGRPRRTENGSSQRRLGEVGSASQSLSGRSESRAYSEERAGSGDDGGDAEWDRERRKGVSAGDGSRHGQDSVRFLDAEEAEEGTVQFEPTSAVKRKIRNRKCTPHPLVAARKVQEDEEDGDGDGENTVLQIGSGARDVDDSSSDSSESYEPEFKKTDEGTLEVTCATANLMEEVLEGHVGTTWVKHNHAQPESMRTSRVQSEVNDDDDQISAILERSALVSTATKSRSAVSDKTLAPALHAPSQQIPTDRQWHPSRLLSPMTELDETRRHDAHEGARPHERDNGLSVGLPTPSHRTEDGLGLGVLPGRDLGESAEQDDRPRMGREGDVHEVEFVTSSAEHGSSISSAERASNAAVHLRKLRDSVASIRKTAAKAQRGSVEESSTTASSIQPVSLFSERKKPQHHTAAVRHRDQADWAAVDSTLAPQHAPGTVRPPTQLGGRQLARTSLSDSKSFDSGTREDHSTETHAAEFRHTLRKSVHKNFRSMPDGLAPTSLFGGTQPRAAISSTVESCPICLEQLEAGTDLHITTCAHRFHGPCYTRYHRTAPMSSRDKCPVCRTSQLPALHHAALDSMLDSARSPPGPAHIASRRDARPQLPSRMISPLHLPSVEAAPSPCHNASGLCSDRREPDFASSLVQANPVFAQSPGLATPWINPSSTAAPLDARSFSAGGESMAFPARAGEPAAQSLGMLHRGTGAAGLLSAMGAEPDEGTLAAAVDGFALPPRRTEMSSAARPVAAPAVMPEVEVEDEEAELAVLARMDSAELRREMEALQRKASAAAADAGESEESSPAQYLAEELRQQAEQHRRAGNSKSKAEDRRGQWGASQQQGWDQDQGNSSPVSRAMALETFSVDQILATEMGSRHGGHGIAADNRGLVEVMLKGRGRGRGCERVTCDTVRDAVAEVNEAGGAMKFLPGVHAWYGDATVRRNGINATCAGLVTLNGQWLFKDGSSGCFQATHHLHTTPQGSEPCILVWGGPWLLDQCEIRSVGGVAVMCADTAAVMMRRCGIGGRKSNERSSTGVSVGGSSRCLVEECTVQFAGTDLGGGAGVRVMETGKCTLERSTVQHCSYCVAVHGSSRVIIRMSTLLAARFSALYADTGSGTATLLLQKSSVACRLWYTRERVGRFEAKDTALIDAEAVA